ncbi:MAG: MaoC family dehydratase N-terminal domain-containing protein [Stomatobaculum sp.]|nr:MaoC family dehydratase N-terminal domain-containing protein [Stomatobaculum sp.]
MGAKFDGNSDWDNLNDVEWMKRFDEKVAEFNEGRGEVKFSPAAHEIMTDEYDRGVNYKYVTEDTIRHFALACGDPNPFWRDPGYIATTRWGTFIAPPLYETSIAFGSAFGGRLRVPGVARLAGGSKHIYYKPIRPGDSFTIYDKYEGFVEKEVHDKPYRMFIESAPRYYVNQNNEVAAVEVHRNIYMATPPSKREGGKKKEAKMYQNKVRKPYSQDILDQIHQSYDDQLAGKFRRGKEIRYWEDVQVGEELPTILRGPVDVADACARTMVSCYAYAYAIKWACMREHLQHHPIDPETNEYILRRDWHYTDHAANLFGYPYANSAGIQNEMMLVQIVTDWMGDDGWVESVDSQDRRMVFFGDMTYVKGKVAKKWEEDGKHLVLINVWGENQDGVLHTKSDYVVRLCSKAEYDKPL